MQHSTRHQSIPSSRPPAKIVIPEAVSDRLHEDGSIGTGGLLNIIKWRAGLIGAVVLAGFAASAIYLIATPPQYTASSQVLFETRHPIIIDTQNPPSTGEADPTLFESQLDIMRSARIAAQSIKKMDLVQTIQTEIAAEQSAGLYRILNSITASFFNLYEGTDQEKDIDVYGVPQKVVHHFLQNLEVQRKGLTYIMLVKYTDRYPQRAAQIVNAIVDSYIAYQHETKQATTEAASKWLKERIAKLRADVVTAEQQVEIIKKDFAKRTQLSAKLTERELEAEAARKLYLSYLTRSKEMEAQASLQAQTALVVIDARVITKAVPPLLPSGPRKAFVLGLGLVAGITVGIAWAVLREQLKPMVRTPQDMERITGLAYLTSLPGVSGGPPKLWNMWFRDKHRLRADEGGEVAQLEARRFPLIDRQRFAILEDQRSQYAQSISTIANAARPINSDESSGTVVAILSSRKGEGRSMTAINLAEYAALSKRSVLLVDCDLRNPTLTTVVRAKPQCGKSKGGKSDLSLVDILIDGVDPENVIVSASPDGLSFCPAPLNNGAYKRPADLLASAEMSSFLNAMRVKFDFIIVDTSPMLPYIDARALIDEADTVFYLVEQGKISHDSLRSALQRARGLGLRSAYGVLNRFV